MEDRIQGAGERRPREGEAPVPSRKPGGGAPGRRRGGGPVRSRGGGGRGGGRREAVPDYLIPSILVLIFCCQIGGIIALIYSVQANSARQAGDYRRGAQAAATAKTWLLVSVILGIVQVIAAFLLLGIGASAQ